MHSRIFGIITKKEYDEHIETEGEIEMPIWQFEQSLPSEMDYVNGDTDLNDDFECLIQCLKRTTDKFEYDSDNHTIKLLEGFKEEYFKPKWDKIKELVNGEKAFERFCTDTMLPFQISEASNDRYSFYQCDEEGYYDSLDGFIRTANINEEYIVFGSIDYHY